MKPAVATALLTLLLGCAAVDPRSRQEKARDFLAKNRTILESNATKLLGDPQLRFFDGPSGQTLSVGELAKGRYVSMIMDGYELQFVEPSPLRDHYARMASSEQSWCKIEGDVFELGGGWFGGHYQLDRGGSGVVRARGPATPHGVFVRLDGPDSFSVERVVNRDGEFCVDWLPAGVYELRTHFPTGYRPYPETLLQARIVVEDHKQTTLTIPQWPEPLPTAFTEVRVRFADGTPAAGTDIMTDFGKIQADVDGTVLLPVLKNRPAQVTALYGYSAWAVLTGRAGARRYVATGVARAGTPLDLVLRSDVGGSP